ncbi:MAG: type 4a pilus biogenesis protein PilO [Fibrobacter sp.]|mgnify:CR=1 FL=1|nr:type 4a pilus biogenesis protein PilO [Fibrobacter sp.]
MTNKKQNVQIQWYYITLTILFIALGCVFVYVHTPLTVDSVKKCMAMYNNAKLAKNSEYYDRETEKVTSDIQILDSVLTVIRNRQNADSKTVMEMLYTYADSAGLRASKVNIGDVIEKNHLRTMAIQIKGSGAYEAIGRFTEALENAVQSVRVRTMNISGENSGDLKVSIDFEVTE